MMVWVKGHYRKKLSGGEAYVDRHHRKLKHKKGFGYKQNKIARRLQGTRVPGKYRKWYGSSYSRREANEAAARIVGSRFGRH